MHAQICGIHADLQSGMHTMPLVSANSEISHTGCFVGMRAMLLLTDGESTAHTYCTAIPSGSCDFEWKMIYV